MRREEIYTERLLQYFDPALARRIPTPSFTATCINDACNDIIDIDAIVDGGIFKQLEYCGRGCCVSQCSAAMLVEYFKGKSVKSVAAFTDQNMFDLVGIQIPSGRKGCVLLGLQCLRNIYGQATASE
jgi:nitrogen fixation NifU-like protein